MANGNRPEPYIKSEPGDIILAENWNEIQVQTKEEIRSHTHKGAEDGTKIKHEDLDLGNDRNPHNTRFSDLKDVENFFFDKEEVSSILKEHSKKIEIEIQKNMEQELRLDYLEQRVSPKSSRLVELFLNENQTADFETAYNRPAEVMDDCDWNNNWKEREGSPNFKNGFLRPRKQAYMLESIDEFNLEGIAQANKGAIKYDAINECYWFISNAGVNAIGEITKLGKRMKDGKVNVFARWYLSAPGANVSWSGIAVDAENKVLFVIAHGIGNNGGMAAIKINDDGTLGLKEKVNGSTLEKPANWSDINGTITFDFSAWWPCIDNYFPNDATIWDENNIAVICAQNASPFNRSLIMRGRTFQSGDFNAPTLPAITGFENYLGAAADPGGLSLIRNNNDLWIKTNVIPTDYRFIYKFIISTDIYENKVIKASSRFDTSRNTDRDGPEGICISIEGDILEVTSTPNNGKFISRRALKNALWAENQVCEEIQLTKLQAGGNEALCFDGNYVWYSANSTNETANQVKLIRRDIATGYEESISITQGNWNRLLSMTIAPVDGNDYFFILGQLAGDVKVSRAIERSIVENALNGTLNIADVGKSFQNYPNRRQLGICTDGTYLYIINNKDGSVKSIERWTIATIPTLDNENYITIPPAKYYWYDITWNNNKFYIFDYDLNSIGKIYEIEDKPCIAGTYTWYRLHIYQYPSNSSSSIHLDFKHNDTMSNNTLYAIEYNTAKLYQIKTLEDPDVLQLHTFMDANNILLSTNVSCCTPIVERYFNPEDFADPRDVPDKYYCAVGYGDNGFSELHLDQYLSGKSSTGKDRYDVRKIRTRHYKKGTVNSRIGCNVIEYGITTNCASILIEKDIIFYGATVSNATYATWMGVIDLKSGKVYNLSPGAALGDIYLGTLSERNDGKGYSLTNNSELTLSSGYIRKIHARTFFRDDSSDYNFEHPKTYVAIGNDGGCDVLVIDWDENGNRTPIKVWNNVFASAILGRYANWIAPSGILFAGDNGDNIPTGYMYYNMFYGLSYIWELASDSGYNNVDTALSKKIGSNILGGYNTDISPNSRCWKTPSNTWRHQLVCGSGEWAGNGAISLAIVDVENIIKENIINRYEAGWHTIFKSIDNFENIIYGISHGYYGFLGISIYKKLKFSDKLVAFFSNGYTSLNQCENTHYGLIVSTSRPLFVGNPWDAAGGGYLTTARFSDIFSILCYANQNSGLQFFHFPNMDQCTHESIEFDCNNPSEYYYIQNAILPSAHSTKIIEKNNPNVSYYGNWENVSAGTDPAELDQSTFGFDEIQIENASNINNCTFTFGASGNICKGNQMILVEGTDFYYDARLDAEGENNRDIYDDNTNGALDPGNNPPLANATKYFRIVENGKNITNSTGLNLKIYAKKLIGESKSWPSPSKDCAYIDPMRGRVVLPCPIYWSRCESDNNIIQYPEISSNDYPAVVSTQLNGPHAIIAFPNGKFNNGMLIQGEYESTSIRTITLQNYRLNRGTISFWFASFANLSYTNGVIQIFLSNSFEVYINKGGNHGPLEISLKINGTQEGNWILLSPSPWPNLDNLFITWDGLGGLSENKSIRVWFKGLEVLSSTTKFSDSDNDLQLYFESHSWLGSGGGTGAHIIDNIKVWKDVIENPEMENNGGTGREDALHSIYGSDNGYKPLVTGSSNGVGYFHSTTAGSYAEWNNITGYNEIGINFERGTDCGKAKVIVDDITSGITIINTDIDLYTSSNYTKNENNYIYRIKLPYKDHNYIVRVEHNGDHNPNATANYSIRIKKYLAVEPLEDSKIEGKLILSHSKHSGYKKEYLLGKNGNIEETITFIADGTTSAFALTGEEQRASEPISFGYLANGDTVIDWNSPLDIDLTWGSNSPDYDDRKIDNDGHFVVKWKEAPGQGTIYIKYKPKADRAKIITTIHQPKKSDYIDYTKNVRLLDYGIELI